MHTRLVTFEGAEELDAGVAYVRDVVVPALNEQRGYCGTTVSVGRSHGVLGVLSLWETEVDREASYGTMAKARQEGLKIVGGELKVEAFEQLFVDISEPPVPGSALMVTRISMSTAKIEENLEFFKIEVLPRIKANGGYRALRHMINRQTGEGLVGAAWADQDAMEAAAADAMSRRQVAISRGVTFGEVSFREIVLTDIR